MYLTVHVYISTTPLYAQRSLKLSQAAVGRNRRKRETPARGRLARGRQAREKLAREKLARENLARERQAREKLARERQARVMAVRVMAVRENQRWRRTLERQLLPPLPPRRCECVLLLISCQFVSVTAEPPNNGHSGDRPLVHCREVVPISKIGGMQFVRSTEVACFSECPLSEVPLYTLKFCLI